MLRFKELAFSTYYEVIAWELHYALVRYNDVWLEVLCKAKEDQPGWLVPIEQRRATVVILTCCLLENIINFYLCTKCTAEPFRKIEKSGFIEKWTEIPKRFLPNYVLPEQSELGKDLKHLRDRRVAIVHPKPMISIDGDGRHKGNEPPVHLDEDSFIERCSSLPFRLVEHILGFDDVFMALCSIRTVCGTVQRGFGLGRRSIHHLGNVPEELVSEIMGQGFKRETALMYAALIGEFPMAEEDGTIRVRRSGREIAHLRPLNYFKRPGIEPHASVNLDQQ